MSGQANLEQAFQELRLSWDKVRPTWNDQRAREFHERVLVPIGPAVRTTLNAMENAETMVNAAKRDCK